MMRHVQVIAEVGECFNGDMDTARQMIHVAKDAGCDTVKFQLLDMVEVATDDPERDWFAKIELDPKRISQLISWGGEEGIDILFTPVSVKTARWLLDAGQRQVKIASSFVKKRELLSFINQNFDLVYASTGMASIDDINLMLTELDRPSEVRLFHCISEYPTGPLLEERGLVAMREEDAHLEMMSMMRCLFPGMKIGYSDHTDEILVPVLAAAMGADMIEKHFTLDKKTPIEHFNRRLEYMGTDHVVSVEPDGLKEMVSLVRRAERIRGERVWERSAGERILIEFLQGRYQRRDSDAGR
ncbi:MAG: N-acetylneuraminate synthase family protein [Treponema sp.]|nr:N-acetylneuraminate synthase family protein [Treponema sp.]